MEERKEMGGDIKEELGGWGGRQNLQRLQLSLAKSKNEE